MDAHLNSSEFPQKMNQFFNDALISLECFICKEITEKIMLPCGHMVCKEW